MEFFRQEYWEWVAISFSRGSSQGLNTGLHVSCIAGGFFTTEPLGKLIKPSIYLEKLVAFMEKKFKLYIHLM